VAINQSLLLLRFFAIILITNSHLDSLYPNPKFGTGGALGNSIFFFISAIGITLSNSPLTQSFISWYKNRGSRVLPSLWLVLLLLIFLGHYNHLAIEQLALLFIFPKEFWFLPALMVMYIPLFFIVRHYSFNLFVKLIIPLCVIYSLWYLWSYEPTRFSIEDFGLFKVFFYLIVMLFGVYIGNNIDDIFRYQKHDLLKLLLVTLLYFASKFFMLKTGRYEWQFITHLLTLPWLVYLAKTFSGNYFKSLFDTSRYRKLVITIVASLTLEIYLIQSIIYNSHAVTSNIFPVNLLVFILLVMLSAFVLQKATIFTRSILVRVVSR